MRFPSCAIPKAPQTLTKFGLIGVSPLITKNKKYIITNDKGLNVSLQSITYLNLRIRLKMNMKV